MVPLSSSVTAISKQSCWSPARRKTLAWHFHSQIMCLLLKIYALACNRRGPEPEHWACPCNIPICTLVRARLRQQIEPSALNLHWFGLMDLLGLLQRPRAHAAAGVLARAPLTQTWLLIRIPSMTRGNDPPWSVQIKDVYLDATKHKG